MINHFAIDAFILILYQYLSQTVRLYCFVKFVKSSLDKGYVVCYSIKSKTKQHLAGRRAHLETYWGSG